MKIVELPFKVKSPILACGADLKGAFALAKSREAFLFDEFADLEDPDNLAKYEKSVKTQMANLGIRPSIVACDLHPGYFSTRFAEGLQIKTHSLKLYRIQHHEAHIASAIVDNNIKGGVIGVAFDGTGYGSDGNIWGGEFFVGSVSKFVRAAHLEYVPMPGGEKAVKEPWRMAVSYLNKTGTGLYFMKKRWACSAGQLNAIAKMTDKKINSPLTSSAGRLFDAAGSLILSKACVSKEAELPIELERLILPGKCGSYKFRFRPDGGGFIIDTAGIIKGIVQDLSGNVKKEEIALKFHNSMADIIAKAVLKISEKFKVNQAVLSGGVFQNKYLTAEAFRLLAAGGIKVYTHSNIAANDFGMPIGQIAIAGARGL